MCRGPDPLPEVVLGLLLFPGVSQRAGTWAGQGEAAQAHWGHCWAKVGTLAGVCCGQVPKRWRAC